MARQYSYWKQKLIMVNKKHLHREHLEQLQKGTDISQLDHDSLDSTYIKEQLKKARNLWKQHKKKGAATQKQFLLDRAELLASKLHTTEERALCSIIQAEESRRSFQCIKALVGKQQSPLSEIDITLESGPTPRHTTLTTKMDMESNLLLRNQQHSMQALTTPMLKYTSLYDAIDSKSPYNRIDDILLGNFSTYNNTQYTFNEIEQEWIASLQRAISTPIPLHLSISDFREYFWNKQE